jgi:hypothetical protein
MSGFCQDPLPSVTAHTVDISKISVVCLTVWSKYTELSLYPSLNVMNYCGQRRTQEFFPLTFLLGQFPLPYLCYYQLLCYVFLPDLLFVCALSVLSFPTNY